VFLRNEDGFQTDRLDNHVGVIISVALKWNVA